MASNNNYVFEVEEILDQRFAGLKIEYLVKWKAADLKDGDADREWLPADQCNCPIAIAKFQKANGQWQDNYEVEGIIDSIEDENGDIEYLVKWKGYSTNECQWVKSADMHCKEVIDRFVRGKQFRDDDLFQVHKVVRKVDDDADGIERFLVTVDDNKKKETLSIDEIYISPGGRKALGKFFKKFV